MKNKLLIFSLLLGGVVMLSACKILDQTSEMKNFAKCSFRVVDLQDAMLAGVDIQDVQQLSDLNFSETTKISMAALSGELPLGFTVNIEVENPNAEKASMNDLYWDLLIDDKEITKGHVSKKISVPPDGGRAVVPVPVMVDLWDVFSGESSEALMNFAMNLAGTGSYPSRVKLRIKPTIYVAMTKVKYPGFFTIEEEFVSE